MAYDYKPGEDDGFLKQYALIISIIIGIAAIVVLILYVGLGIDGETLIILAKRLHLDATNLTFLFVFIMASLALWGLFRDPAATEGVNRRQGYFILLLLLAGILLAGTIYFKRFAKPTHEVLTTEKCPRCGGTGRARLRPEYPCATCDGTGYITP